MKVCLADEDAARIAAEAIIERKRKEYLPYLVTLI